MTSRRAVLSVVQTFGLALLPTHAAAQSSGEAGGSQGAVAEMARSHEPASPRRRTRHSARSLWAVQKEASGSYSLRRRFALRRCCLCCTADRRATHGSRFAIAFRTSAHAMA